MKKYILLGLAIASVGRAQLSGGIDSPVLGLVPDRNAAGVRTIVGVPGAATLGPSVSGSIRIRAAATAANGVYALAVGVDGTPLIVTSTASRVLERGMPNAERAIVSPRGTAVALVFASGAVQVFTGMPDTPVAAGVIETGGAPSTAAVSDDGVLMWVTRERRGPDSVYAYVDGGRRAIFRAPRITAVAFLPNTRQALVAESSSAWIVAPDLGAQPAGIDPDGGIVAVAGSADGSQVFLASGSGRVTIYDIRSRDSVSVQCSCSPRAFEPLRGKSVFRLNEAGDGPVWLLDAGGGEPRISFVAAGGVE